MSDLRYCPTCEKMYSLTGGHDSLVGQIGKTNSLETCPQCKNPLRNPHAEDYIWANKAASAREKTAERVQHHKDAGTIARITAEVNRLKKQVEQLTAELAAERAKHINPRRCKNPDCQEVFTPLRKNHFFHSEECRHHYNNEQKKRDRQLKKTHDTDCVSQNFFKPEKPDEHAEKK